MNTKIISREEWAGGHGLRLYGSTWWITMHPFFSPILTKTKAAGIKEARVRLGYDAEAQAIHNDMTEKEYVTNFMPVTRYAKVALWIPRGGEIEDIRILWLQGERISINDEELVELLDAMREDFE